jgi:hypothetical protein
MRTCMTALALFAAAADWRAEAAAPKSDEERVEQAREALRRRLVDAQSEGVVAIRGETPDKADISPTSDSATARAILNQPTLRDAAAGDACATPDELRSVAASLGERPHETIEALRRDAAAPTIVGAENLASKLAVAYLVIGFAEEARAIAKGQEGAAAASVSGLAELMIGIAPEAASIDGGCGPIPRLLRNARGLMTGVDAAPDGQDLALLARYPAPIAAAIAESLTPYAIARKNDKLLEGLRRILATSSSVSRAAALIDYVRAENDNGHDELTDSVRLIASEPGPLQAQALQAMATKGVQYPAFDDDLEDAAAAAPERARAQFDFIIAERQLKANDVQRAVRALSRAARANPAIEPKARKIAGEALNKSLLSDDSDQVIAATAALASEPGFAGPAVSTQAASVARDALIRVGAAANIDALLHARGAGVAERDLAVAEAHLSFARMAEALAVTERHAADKRFDTLRARLGPTSNIVVAAGLQDAQRSGDPLFGPPPTRVNPPAVIRFSQGVKSEIANIRERLSQ